jgi:hypothetical protein
MDSIIRGEPRNTVNSEGAKQRMQAQTPLVSPPLLPIAPKLMLLFWMLLGAVAGITLAQQVWRLAGLTSGNFAIAVPVGAVGGALGGVLVGRITHPHLLVLVMALLAGWSVGALAGGLAWADIGQITGGFIGALVGGLTWGAWLLRRRGNEIKGQNSASVPRPTQ